MNNKNVSNSCPSIFSFGTPIVQNFRRNKTFLNSDLQKMFIIKCSLQLCLILSVVIKCRFNKPLRSHMWRWTPNFSSDYKDEPRYVFLTLILILRFTIICIVRTWYQRQNMSRSIFCIPAGLSVATLNYFEYG